MSTLLSAELLSNAALQQSVYRAILNAFSYPGRVQEIDAPTQSELGTSNEGLLDAHNPSIALMLVLSTLVDETVTLADPSSRVCDELRHLLGCKITDIENSDFVVADGSKPWLASQSPRLGDLYRPDQGATLILQCERIGMGSTELKVRGPGVEQESSCDWMA